MEVELGLASYERAEPIILRERISERAVSKLSLSPALWLCTGAASTRFDQGTCTIFYFIFGGGGGGGGGGGDGVVVWGGTG